MDLEYLVVGIAKEKHDDFVTFYEKTRVAAYVCALSYVKDRFIARDIAAESYRRVKNLAYKFDTDMNAEYWLLDIVKNLSVNALCDGGIASKAKNGDMSNVSLIVKEAITEGTEERGRIAVLRNGSDLSKSEISRLLWYNASSCANEYRREMKLLAKTSGLTFKETESEFKNDLALCTPDYLDYIESDIPTMVSSVSHSELNNDESKYALPGESKDARRLRLAMAEEKNRKKKIIVAGILAAVVLLAAVAVLVTVFAKARTSVDTGDDDEIEIYEPQYNTSIAVTSYGSRIYFQNLVKGGIYYIDTSSESLEPVKLTDTDVREIAVNGEYVYYRASDDGRLYRMSVNGGEAEKLSVRGALVRFLDDKIVYSSTEGISIMNADGTDSELIYDAEALNLLREDIEVSDYGAVFFSAGSTGGLYRLQKRGEDGEYIRDPVTTDDTYSFVLEGDRLFFDEDNGDGSGTLVMFAVGEEDAFDRYDMSAVLLSAAYDACDGYVYYFGCSELKSDGTRTAKGIYRIKYTDSDKYKVGEYTGEPELVIDLSSSKYDVSDLYVENGMIFCFFSGGTSNTYMKLSCYGTDGAETVLMESGKK